MERSVRHRFAYYTLVMMVVVWLGTMVIDTAKAAPSGEKIFTANCAGCHMGGKNLIDPKKPVIGSKKLASKGTFKALLNSTIGGMPSFPKISGNDEALEALYVYVKGLK